MECITFLLILVSACFVFSVEVDEIINREKYFKVSSTLPNDINNTKIDTICTGSDDRRIRFMCLGFCTRTADCTLACFNDQTCSIYSAIVSSKWDPAGPYVHNALQTLNYQCFSSWYFQNDITSKITSYARSSVDLRVLGHLKYNLNGFYGAGGYNVWISENSTKPWARYDFGKVVKIQKIITKARNDSLNDPGFHNVEARVGNSSVTGDFSSYSLLAYYSEIGGQGDLVVFDGSQPLVGRFVSLQIIDSAQSLFTIASINIIGQII